jgi:hypothetical protein
LDGFGEKIGWLLPMNGMSSMRVAMIPCGLDCLLARPW